MAGISPGVLYISCSEVSGVFDVPFKSTIGSLSNDDDNSNENSKKAIGLDWQNNNFAHALLFLYISLPSLHDYDLKMPNFVF